MVIAYHLVWTGYGWWLPNDPRGSMSRGIRVASIAELGEIHFGRRKQQPSPTKVRDFQQHAQHALKHRVLTLHDEQIAVVGAGFAETIAECRYTCYACAILPDHVHILIRKHRDKAEVMIANLQAQSRERLLDSGTVPPNHPVWTVNGWKTFLDSPSAVRQCIRYIEDNLRRANRPRQQWAFVAEYDGWPLHPGHNPNSPYARGLQNRRR